MLERHPLTLRRFRPLEDVYEKTRPITFGVELEGVLSYLPLFKKAGMARALMATLKAKADNKTRTCFAENLQKRAPDLTFEPGRTYVDGIWTIDGDGSIHPPPFYADIEVRSPILQGEKGLSTIETAFKAAAKEGLTTNKFSGLHIHVSLGWSRVILDAKNPETCVQEQRRTQEEVLNIYEAYWLNRPFFRGLTAPHRLNDMHCKENRDSPQELRSKSMNSFYCCWEKSYAFSAKSLLTFGTVEWRMKEAANYQASLDFIRFIVNFTTLAAKNPRLDAARLWEESQTPEKTPAPPQTGRGYAHSAAPKEAYAL